MRLHHAGAAVGGQQFGLLDKPGLGKPLITVCLILHDVLAIALLAFVTFQAAVMGDASGAPQPSFLARHRQIDVSGLAPVIILLLVSVILLGATLYPAYRMQIRPYLEAHQLMRANGAFEVKEHFAALALLAMPAYWAAWRRPLAPAYGPARRMLTWLIAGMVWWNFIVGHIINYISGVLS